MSTSTAFVSRAKCSAIDVSQICFNAQHIDANDDPMHMSDQMDQVSSMIFHALASTLIPDIHTSPLRLSLLGELSMSACRRQPTAYNAKAFEGTFPSTCILGILGGSPTRRCWEKSR
eukprot:scaffold2657_cov368-Pavlova_lutheri.AAC.5